MALITALVGFLGRFVGRVLTTTLGWASVLLFGRIPQGRQVLFAVLTFGALIWALTLVGILLPEVGVFLISFVPLPGWVDKDLVRLAMLAAAVLLPAVLGAVTLLIADPADRPRGLALIPAIVRGYLVTPVLAATLVLLAVAGTVRKARAVVKRRSTGHIPIVVRPDRYEALVDQLEGILRDPGLSTTRRNGSRFLTAPARLLAAASGAGLRRLVPERLAVLDGPEMDLEIYPSDLSLTGTKLGLARARAAILRDLDSQNCWFTTQPDGQKIEDQLARIDRSADSWDAGVVRDVDRRLASDAIPDEEWDVLYRRRLQVAAEATGTNLAERAIASPTSRSGADVPDRPRPPAESFGGAPGRPSAGTVVGLVTAGLVVADIVLLATRDRNGRH